MGSEKRKAKSITRCALPSPLRRDDRKEQSHPLLSSSLPQLPPQAYLELRLEIHYRSSRTLRRLVLSSISTFFVQIFPPPLFCAYTDPHDATRSSFFRVAWGVRVQREQHFFMFVLKVLLPMQFT